LFYLEFLCHLNKREWQRLTSFTGVVWFRYQFIKNDYKDKENSATLLYGPILFTYKRWTGALDRAPV